MSPKTEAQGTPVLRAGRVTLRDIGKRLGLSHMTVSLCLRDHHSIPLKRREEVKLVAEEMGYRPDPWLSSLVVYRNQKHPLHIRSAIAWINRWPQPEQLRKFREFDLYWCGALRAAERFGYHLDEINWSGDCSAQRIEKILLTRNIRGLLIPPHQTPLEWDNFDWKKFSIIRFGMSVPAPDAHAVTADHQRAVLMVFRRMIEYGYQRIGMVVSADYDIHLGGNYIGGLAAAQELFKANFLGGLAMARDVFRLKCILPTLQTNENVYVQNPVLAKRLLSQWLKKHKPDAILTSVSKVPAMIRELGHHIPKDIAIAGTTVYDVPVEAGIDQNPEAIGRIAVETLIAQINRSEFGVPPSPCRILVESCWRDGKSLPPKRQSI